MPVRYRNHTCAACGTTRRAIDAGPCAACGSCASCCRCRTAGRVPSRGTPTVPTFHGEPSALFPRYVGVEIECGLTNLRGTQLALTVEAWNASVVPDGSVHVPGACEIVTAPARGADFEAQVRDIAGALSWHAAKVDKTCGLHAHIDARGASYADLCRLARVYSKVESGLYNLVAPSRRKNTQFCRAWGPTFDRAGVFAAESNADKERTLDCAIYGSVDAARSAKQSARNGYKYHGSRYRSLNLHSFHIRGTVEFRLHHGTTDADKIIMWGAVCSAIVHFAFTHTDDEVFALRGTPAEILDRIVASPLVRAWMAKRREKFAALRSRAHPGQPPRRRAPAPPAPPVPVVSAGVHEDSESR